MPAPASAGQAPGVVRQPDAILTDPEVLRAIDFDRPVAVLLVAILMFLRDAEEPHRIVDRLKAAVPSGSYLVVSHTTPDFNPEAAAVASAPTTRPPQP